jgi:hypothetical protein
MVLLQRKSSCDISNFTAIYCRGLSNTGPGPPQRIQPHSEMKCQSITLHKHTNKHKHTNTHTNAHTQTHTNTHTQTHTHTNTHTNTQTHTHKYTHTHCSKSLDEESARCRELLLTTYDIYRRQTDRQTSTPPGGIRTRNPSKRAATEPRLRLRGHRNRPV